MSISQSRPAQKSLLAHGNGKILSVEQTLSFDLIENHVYNNKGAGPSDACTAVHQNGAGVRNAALTFVHVVEEVQNTAGI